MKRKNLLVIYLTAIIDFLGVGLVIPIFAPLFLDPTSTLFGTNTTETQKNILFGISLAIFPFFQFFGAPILGALSDKFGRKKILFLSIFGTFLGYLLMIIGIEYGFIFLILLSRAIDGFTGGNISVATSAISDISTQEEKVKNFGILGALFGVCFIVGPFLGGKLSDPLVHPSFSFVTPFLFSALLSFLNLISVAFFFKETLSQRIERTVTLNTGIKNLKKAFSNQKFKTIFTVVFLITLGFSFFTTFFQPYLLSKFNFNQNQIGELFAYIGFWIALTQGFLLKHISKYLNQNKSVFYGALFLAISLLLLIFPSDSFYIYLITPLVAISNGILSPNYQSIISNLADENSQGEIFGINQSVSAIGVGLAPLIGGFLLNLDPKVPLIMSSIIILASAWIFKLRFKA